ncbi:release factor glutamine methyltransferase [Marinithermofilum abyssi]|uniref:Release factor glutamine methyltransferase n=1 Tax=Marinithermofilum abyssi TaxID=1571185 RepID=A0A8J2VE42_9BACL|nr:peptide chain release factor N(5)-glutamine methyltransferase [Marinithermofilum abyssi]GGE05368.1 release factor glutamine methyltransferase [Marinithermofilum abyssi]
MNPQVTIGEAYRWASSFLQRFRGEDAAFEAELLLRSVLGWDRTRLFTRMDEPIPAPALQQLNEWLELRKKDVPLQYILGEQEFYGRPFHVNQGVLIPRPETEILVETFLELGDSLKKEGLDAVDAGTGSGAIAVTVALERPHWHVHAVDRSPDALKTARKNAERLGAVRLTWHQGEWLAPLMQQGIQVDGLISNPPYIPSGVISTLDKQVREYEPRLALDGGEDGLHPYRILLTQLPQVLRTPGLVAFEVGEGQSRDVENMMRSLPAKVETFIRRDLAGIERVVGCMVKKWV